jgi:hypothetical protein
MSLKQKKFFTIGMIGTGLFFGIWAMAALVGGLYRVNWQLTELIRHYLVATGMIKPFHTIVDFYTHIKGIEYIICLGFFVAFPLFYQYLEKEKKKTRTPVKLS